MSDLDCKIGDAIARLTMMANGDDKWDLSSNDRAAIRYALDRCLEVASYNAMSIDMLLAADPRVVADAPNYHVIIAGSGIQTLVSYGHDRAGALAHVAAWPGGAVVAYETRRTCRRIAPPHSTSAQPDPNGKASTRDEEKSDE